jgi:hypothetical protein
VPGAAVYSLATIAMIQNINIRWSFRITALVACGVNPRPEEEDQT